MCNGNVNLGGQMQQRSGLYVLVHQQQQTATDPNAEERSRVICMVFFSQEMWLSSVSATDVSTILKHW